MIRLYVIWYGLCVSVSQKLIKQQRFIFISQIKIYIFVVSDRKYNMWVELNIFKNLLICLSYVKNVLTITILELTAFYVNLYVAICEIVNNNQWIDLFENTASLL